MNGTAVRLMIATVLVALSYGGIYVVRKSTALPTVRPPAEDIHKLPNRLGKFVGEDIQLDKDLFDRVGAEQVVERVYRDESDHIVSMHLAVFNDPDTGVYHSPTNCYRSAGWRLVKEEIVEVPDSGQPALRVDLTTWERQGETILVLYWYRFGDYTVFERFDLGKARWAMRGQASWPSMIKVLLHTPVTDSAFSARHRMLEMAKQIHLWVSRWDVPAKADSAGK
jgi:EpsI family protein